MYPEIAPLVRPAGAPSLAGTFGEGAWVDIKSGLSDARPRWYLAEARREPLFRLARNSHRTSADAAARKKREKHLTFDGFRYIFASVPSLLLDRFHAGYLVRFGT